MNPNDYRTWIDPLIEWSRSDIERLLAQEGETTLLEVAENRIRDLEELKATVIKLRTALELNQSFLSAMEKLNPDVSCPQLMEQNDAALVISTTDNAWTKPLYHTLGLLRAARSHVPPAGFSGKLPIALDKEIERLEKLLAHEELSSDPITVT